MIVRAIRCLCLGALLLIGLTLAAEGRVSAARPLPATITIHKAECPAGYAGDDPFTDCHDNRVAGVTFEWLVLAPGPSETVTTDSEGVAVIETTGLYHGVSIVEEPPYALDRILVSCSENDGTESVEIRYLPEDAGIVIPSGSPAGGEEIVCDWYNIPLEASDGDVTTLPSTGGGRVNGSSQEGLLLALALVVAGGFGLGSRCRRATR